MYDWKGQECKVKTSAMADHMYWCQWVSSLKYMPHNSGIFCSG